MMKVVYCTVINDFCSSLDTIIRIAWFFLVFVSSDLVHNLLVYDTSTGGTRSARQGHVSNETTKSWSELLVGECEKRDQEIRLESTEHGSSSEREPGWRWWIVGRCVLARFFCVRLLSEYANLCCFAQNWAINSRVRFSNISLAALVLDSRYMPFYPVPLQACHTRQMPWSKAAIDLSLDKTIIWMISEFLLRTMTPCSRHKKNNRTLCCYAPLKYYPGGMDGVPWPISTFSLRYVTAVRQTNSSSSSTTLLLTWYS